MSIIIMVVGPRPKQVEIFINDTNNNLPLSFVCYKGTRYTTITSTVISIHTACIA